MADTTHISETVSAGQLRAFIERIERVEEEIKTLNADKSEIYKELRGCGFDVKAVRQCVSARKLDSVEREERNAIFDLYWSALTGSVHVHTPARENIEEFSPAPERKAAGHAPREMGSEGANTEYDDVDGSTERAGHAGQPFDALTGQVEPGIEKTFVERNTSGPDAKRAPHSNPQPVPAGQQAVATVEDKTGEAVSPPNVSPVAISDGDVPAFLKQDKPRKTAADYRPNCQRPEACGSSGLHHCYQCQKAIGTEAVPA